MKKIICILALFCFILSRLAMSQTFQALDGNAVSYSDMTSCPKTILFNWATWCPYCLKELKKLSNECTSCSDVDIWYINVQESESTVKKFVDSRKIRSCVRQKIILDKEALIAQKFSLVALPTFVFLKYGQPVYKSYFLNEKLIKEVFKDKKN